MNYPGLAGGAAENFDRRGSVVVVGALTAIALAAVVMRLSTVPVHGILPMLMGFIIVTEFISSILFWDLLLRSRLPAAAFAAAGNLLSATLAFPYLFFFPNVFARGVPFGRAVQLSFEFWIAWHVMYAISIAAYAVVLRFGSPETRHPKRFALLTLASIAFIAIVTSAAIVSGVVRAPLMDGTRFTRLSLDAVMPAMCAIDLIAIAVLWACTRLRSGLHLWLTVALYASLLDVLLGISSNRYTSGWYAGKFLALASSATMVALFLWVFSRMYGDAVRAHDELGRARERDAELREVHRERQARLRSQAGSLASAGTWEIDAQSGRVHWSDELYAMFGLPVNSVVSPETYLARVHPDDRLQARALFDVTVPDALASYTHRLIAGDGSVRVIEGRAERIRGADGGLERWFGTTVDRTERASIEARLSKALESDATTGLPNRASARNHLIDLLMRRAHSGALPMAIMVVDVDRMKMVNDAVGHVGGDRFLAAIAARIREAAGGSFVARSNGDEFLVVLERFDERDDAAVFARRMLKAVSPATMIFDREFALSVSIGIAMFPADGVTADELIRCADIAMYEAKAGGRNTVRFFSSVMRDQQSENAVLEGEIRSALRAQQFHLEYQPIVDAHSGELFGAEALLRWMHPTRGPVSPTVIVDIAERSGLMGRLGAWVLSEGIRQRSRWANRRLTLSLNVSASQLQNQDFTLLLGRMLASSGVSPGAIELEITESVAMEGALVADQMRSCNSLGVHFALDDFGTHYSSLTYLQQLAVDRIKIDRTFVRELPSNARDAAIVRALIALAHSLGRTVIAEGVEDRRQLEWLREADCDYVQGYAIARPMKADAFEKWMALPGNATASRLHVGTTEE